MGGGIAQAVYLFVYVCFFFDVSISAGEVGFGLVVIVVRNKIMHGIVREEFLKFGSELGGQGFVVGDNKGRPVQLGYNISHAVRFPAARDA